MAELTPEQRIEAIKVRTENIRTKKIQAEAQLQVLQQQYNQKVEELKLMGLTDLSTDNMNATILNMETELQVLLKQTEANVSSLEVTVL